MREWLPGPGRARLTASPSRTTKKKLRARETVSHWTRGASWIFRDRGESGIHNSPMTARNSVTRHRVFLLGAERKEKPNALTAGIEAKSIPATTWRASSRTRGFGVLVRFTQHPGHSICTGQHVRPSLHVHGQPRGVGRWPRRHRRAHGSRRGEQGRRRRKQRVLPREGVRQDDDEVVARGCVPAHPADERETQSARGRDRARDDDARSVPVPTTCRRAARPAPRVDGASDPDASPAGVGKKRRVHRGFFSPRLPW